MPKNPDWLPSAKQQKIKMAHAWLKVMNSPVTAAATGHQTTKARACNIPLQAGTRLGNLTASASQAFAAQNDRTTRSEVTVAATNTAISELTDCMRDLKKRYFHDPPLEAADFVAMGLRPHTGARTSASAPVSEFSVEHFLIGRHQLGIRITCVSGTPDDPANKGFSIWYRVVARGETPPTTPDSLNKALFTRRKRMVINFDFADSGKIVWMAVQAENDGRKGPWGPLVNALIP
jgi:hypothetical protein